MRANFAAAIHVGFVWLAASSDYVLKHDWTRISSLYPVKAGGKGTRPLEATALQGWLPARGFDELPAGVDKVGLEMR
jgi:hypothetical protein